MYRNFLFVLIINVAKKYPQKKKISITVQTAQSLKSILEIWSLCYIYSLVTWCLSIWPNDSEAHRTYFYEKYSIFFLVNSFLHFLIVINFYSFRLSLQATPTSKITRIISYQHLGCLWSFWGSYKTIHLQVKYYIYKQ